MAAMTLRTPLALLALAAALATGACAADTPATTPGPSGTLGPGAAGATSAAADTPAGGPDACLKGKWAADVDAMAKAAAKLGGAEGRSGKGTGSLTLEFADQMTITYTDVVISIESRVADATIAAKTTINGSATSTSYTTEGGKIGGTMPGGKITTKSVMSMNGVEQPLPDGGFDGNIDISKNKLAYTCSGDQATLDSGFVSWTLTRIS